MDLTGKPLQQERQPPAGFYHTRNAVSWSAWKEIQQWLNLDLEDPELGLKEMSNTCNSSSERIPWEPSPSEQARPVAQFGFRYNYGKRCVDTETPTPPIPTILQRLLLKTTLIDENNDSIKSLLQNQKFTQCIINAYKPNSSLIPWHVDDPQFGPIVLVFIFGETRPLQMRLGLNEASEKQQLQQRRVYSTTSSEGNDYVYFMANVQHLDRYILSGDARERWEHSVPVGASWRISITYRTWRG